MKYAMEHGYTDADRFDEYLMEYLQTPEAASIINQWGSKIFESFRDIEISDGQIKEMAQKLAAGYLTYASEHHLPDLTKMDDYFVDYLNTEDGKAALSSGIGSMIDMESLESQVGTALESYIPEPSPRHWKARLLLLLHRLPDRCKVVFRLSCSRLWDR